MAIVGIFFGSDTGNTESVARAIHTQLGSNLALIYDIAQCTKKDLEQFDLLLFGIPTWYYGEAQCDWDDFFPTLKEINFKGKTVAIFGCGDQEDYTEYFCDAMGILHGILKSMGANIVGYWPAADYCFESTKALLDKETFVGLAIDEDRQPELTAQRISSWVTKIKEEMKLP